MGEVIAAAMVLIFLGGGGALVAQAIASENRKKMLTHTPIQALAPGDSDGARVKAEQYFRMSQSAVRIMENLLADDMTRVVIPEPKQQQMQQIIDRFYDL